MSFHSPFSTSQILPATLGVLLALAGASAAQGTVIYDSYGFEPSPPAPAGAGFTIGELAGQNGWKSLSPTNSSKIVVENSVKYAGSQAIELQADTANSVNLVARQGLSAPLTVNHFVDFQFYTTASAKTSFNIRDGSGGSSGSLVIALDFNSDGTIHQSTTTLNGVLTTGQWNRITLLVEPSAADSKFDLYVNGIKTDTGIAMLASGGSHSIQQYDFQRNKRSNNAGSLYIDNFQITDANPIPEPAMLGLLTAGGFLLLRRRRNLRVALDITLYRSPQ